MYYCYIFDDSTRLCCVHKFKSKNKSNLNNEYYTSKEQRIYILRPYYDENYIFLRLNEIVAFHSIHHSQYDTYESQNDHQTT